MPDGHHAFRPACPGPRPQRPRDIAEGGLLTYARPMAKKIKVIVEITLRDPNKPTVEVSVEGGDNSARDSALREPEAGTAFDDKPGQAGSMDAGQRVPDK